MKRSLQTLVQAAGAALATQLYSILLPSHDFWMALVLSSFGGALMVALVEAIVERAPRASATLRRRLDPAARFEGHWLIEVPNFLDRPHAYAHIFYNPSSEEWAVEGFAFDKDWTFKALWKSTRLSVDTERNQIQYFYEATLLDSDSAVHGFAVIDLHPTSSGPAQKGHGFFVDAGKPLQRGNQEFTRLSPESLRVLIQSHDVHGPEDAKRLLQSYHGRAALRPT